jgi:phosphohistidine phosphatase
MAKLIFLLRHAKSSWDEPGVADVERPLSPRGERTARRMGRRMADNPLLPELVLCSPARRTVDTLALVEQELGAKLSTRMEPAIYLAEPRALLDLLRKAPDDIERLMLVGHDPGLPRLALILTRGQSGAVIERLKAKFPTGALAIIECEATRWRELKPGACRLSTFIVPREL